MPGIDGLALVRAYRAEEQRLDWLSVSYNIAAMDLWDDEAWFELASSQAELARATGTLSSIPISPRHRLTSGFSSRGWWRLATPSVGSPTIVAGNAPPP